MPGIDAILFGHAHNEVAQRFVTNKATGRQVLLTEPSRWGQRLSVIDFTLTEERGQWAVTGEVLATLNTNTVAEDPKIVALVKTQHDAMVTYVNSGGGLDRGDCRRPSRRTRTPRSWTTSTRSRPRR